MSIRRVWQRRRRREPTKQEVKAMELQARVALRLSVLKVGVALECSKVNDYQDYSRLLDFITTDLGPAVASADSANRAYEKAKELGFEKWSKQRKKEKGSA